MSLVDIRLAKSLLEYMTEAAAEGKIVTRTVDGQSKLLFDSIEVEVDDAPLDRNVKVVLRFRLRGRTVVTCDWTAIPHDVLELSGFDGEVDLNLQAEASPF